MRTLIRPWVLAPSVVLSVVWAAFAILPAQTNAFSAEARLELALNEQRSGIVDRVNLEAFRAEAESVSRRFEEVNAAIPAGPEIADFVRMLDRLADSSDLVIDSVAPNAVSDAYTFDGNDPLPIGVSAVTVAIGATGSYLGISEFLLGLDTDPRLVLVDAVSVTAIDDQPDVLALDLTLRVFTTKQLVQDDGASAFDDEFDGGEA